MGKETSCFLSAVRYQRFMNCIFMNALISNVVLQAIFQPPKPIRGGIPLCFPQFSNFGPLQSHGFARNRLWTIEKPAFPHNVTHSDSVDLLLKPTEEDMKLWPNSFEYRLRVTLGGRGNLMMTSRIKNTNTDGNPFNFTFAYHNYFSVSNISEVKVEGLQKLDYLDNLQNRERFTDQGDAITIQSEFDKIYLSTPKKVEILDHGKKQTLTIFKDGLPDSVVWNPWEKKAKTMADMGDEEYRNMVAVESAAIEKPITLKANEEWKVTQELSAGPSSKSS
uniref:putative glucose-6-phosphate 1-epimerase isoform X3 n=1 Tax=Erigeron canadensis TaxID=72917 RepID=UPI001CB8FDC7|nr:putative glucose-6-phosphate 1-epimerase isoform X3 [Erigeron canadensis]